MWCGSSRSSSRAPAEYAPTPLAPLSLPTPLPLLPPLLAPPPLHKPTCPATTSFEKRLKPDLHKLPTRAQRRQALPDEGHEAQDP
jgi:hypothetical protein